MTIDELIRLINASSQHRYVYHFTDKSNLESIIQHGLLSKEQMRERRLWPPKATGGNQLSWSLDTSRGIDPYVSLCMTRNHGMKYLAEREKRLKDPLYLGISPDVFNIDGVKIAFGVANSNDVEILPISEAIDKLDVDVLYNRTDWSDPEIQARLRLAEKFEVLVPACVPKNLIKVKF